VDVNGDAYAFADQTDLVNVVDNLVENAVRYCPPGTEVSVTTRVADGCGVLIVSDTGPGIPAADREHIFERFYRGSNGKQLHAGTGLGLAIVAEIVTRWGGRVQLLDGPGTRIEVKLPAPPTDS